MRYVLAIFIEIPIPINNIFLIKFEHRNYFGIKPLEIRIIL